MNLDLLLQLGGIVQLGIAGANLLAPRRFAYRENLARVSPIVREIFVVHCIYIVLVVLFFAAVCLLLPDELHGGCALGRVLSGFLAAFWGLRMLIQLVFYDRALRHAAPVLDALFVGAFGYLTAVFLWAALA